MSNKINYTHVVDTLEANINGVRCTDLTELLKSLGFDIRNGKRGGHKLFFHDGVPEFRSGSFDCGHKKNTVVKKPYIKKILKILKQYENELCNE